MSNKEAKRIVHPIEAVYDKNSKILILGSFPSVKSREYGFFYGHPQNRFWRIVARICNEATPVTNEGKAKFLLNNNIALWDVIESCEIVGSSDSSIKNVKVNDINKILDVADISAVFTNGKTADKLFKSYLEEVTGIKTICLPSTSPANAAWNEERLYEHWKRELSKYK